MARQKGANNFAGTLEILAAAPLDARSIVTTKTELTRSGNFPYPYIGMEVFVVSETKKYILIGSDTTVEANWQEEGSGGGGGGGEGGTMLTGTLAAASWSSKTQTVTISGIKTNSIGTIGLLETATFAQIEAARNAVITVTAIAENSVTFACEETPSIDIPFGVLIGGGGSGGGASDLADLGDVNLSSPSNDDVLKYDSTSGKWVNGQGGGHEIKDDGTAMTQRSAMNFTDFDVSDDSTNDETDVKAHRLTSAEMTEIISPLPGTPREGVVVDARSNEIEIGTYIEPDGTEKRLYQKTLVFPQLTLSSQMQSYNLAHGISNFDHLVGETGYYTAGNVTVPYPKWHIGTNGGNVVNVMIACDGITSTEYLLLYQSNASTYSFKVVTTIQYTKTTS